MTTVPVRKFALSVDPEEVVDFAEPLSYFEEELLGIGFEKISSYKFRFADRECTMTADLVASTDGFELWMTVQAPDEHEYRLQEIADAFVAYPISSSGTQRIGSSGTFNPATGTHRY